MSEVISAMCSYTSYKEGSSFSKFQKTLLHDTVWVQRYEYGKLLYSPAEQNTT